MNRFFEMNGSKEPIRGSESDARLHSLTSVQVYTNDTPEWAKKTTTPEWAWFSIVGLLPVATSLSTLFKHRSGEQGSADR